MDETLTPTDALALIKPFFDEHNYWSRISDEDVKIRKLKGGYCNSIWLVESFATNAIKTPFPASLVIRIKGGNIVNLDDVTFNVDNVCKIVAFRMSQQKIGPKLFGVCTNYSIEEFISGQTLSYQDANDEVISKDIAQKLASVHSMKNIPLRSDSFEVMIQRIQKNAETFKREKVDALRHHESLSRYGVDVQKMESFDFQSEVKFLEKLTKNLSKNLRKSFILLDMNYLNCMIRDANAEDKVVLIDYDLCQYNYRGIDLGAHFFFRIFKWDDPINKFVDGADHPTLEQKRRFLKQYQDEIKRLEAHQDFDGDGIDSVDNLLIESLIGSMIHVIFFLSWFLSKCDLFLDFDASFLKVNDYRVDYYLESKRQLLHLLDNRINMTKDAQDTPDETSTDEIKDKTPNIDISSVTDLDADLSIRILSKFFPKEWKFVDANNVEVGVLKGGLCSCIWRVTRRPDDKVDAIEPLSVLIKKKGGASVDVDQDFGFNDSVAINILANEIGARRVGPQIYGLLKGGSVEEFIPSHTLSAKESSDEIISKDIAQNLASIHSLSDIPIQRDAFEIMMRKITENAEKFLSKKDLLINSVGFLSASDKQKIIDFDFEEQKSWILRIIPKFRMRRNLILLDVGYLNCLVKETPNDADTKSSRRDAKDEDADDEIRKSSVVLIDYDLAQYNYRGIDLGQHFISRLFAAKDDEDARLFTDKEKRRFLQNYQDEIKRLNVWNDFDDQGVDSVDNLLIESKIGFLISNVFFCTFLLSKLEIFLSVETPFLKHVPFCLDHYLDVKHEIDGIIDAKTS